MTNRTEKIGIVGSGLIGRSWAMLFASAGYNIALYDVEEKQVLSALEEIGKQLKSLEKSKMLKGTLSAEEQIACIKGTQSLEECMSNCKHVQECVPEDLELKIKVFKEMDKLAGPQTVLSSSTSCILPSQFTKDLVHKANCIISHPYNPPYYVPAVEVIPAPWTSKEVVSRTCDLLREIEMTPLEFSRESIGFASNRIQYAILNECWHLVNDGILSASDVDNMMTEGLALRYAWMGPLETAHLNAEGLENYIQRYGATINSVSSTYKPTPTWETGNAEMFIKQLETRIPLEKLQERRAWRDERLIALINLKKQWKQKEGQMAK